MTELRKCEKCGTEKELLENNFRPHGTGHEGFRYTCRECERIAIKNLRAANPERYAAQSREWSKTHPEQRNATKRQWRLNNPRTYKSSVLKRTYGITLEQYEAMHIAQAGVCAICKTSTTGAENRKLFVDHCHRTGKVRGLLCGKCNSTLGFMKDNPEWLDKAKAYLLAAISPDSVSSTPLAPSQSAGTPEKS